MSVPPPPPFGGPAGSPSALPDGWTEHVSPQGHPYYYNAGTGQSTYAHPAPATNTSAPPPPPPLPAGFNQQPGPAGSVASSSSAPITTIPKKKKKKEKPVAKVVIEGTPWLQITTNEGNVFYTNTETKSSVWTVPEEIQKQVEALAKGAQNGEGGESEAAKLLKEKEEEMARLREELEAEREASRKRKVREEQEEEEEQHRLEEQAKRLRLMQQAREEAEQADAQAEPGSPADEQAQEEEEEEEGIAVGEEQAELEPELEDWQKDELRVKAEMEAELAEEEAAAQETALAESQKSKKAESKPAVAAEEQLSSEEGLALFRTMLAEKEINPMKPWDMELPKFINDARYKAVKSLRERKDLFDEHCRLKIRENRAKKAGGGQAKADPASAYRALLVAEVTSTRTHWEDFKKTHKKDTRFREFGRDEREREKAFRQWLRDLGEIKRADAQKAEEKFVQMLSEQTDLAESSSWSSIKSRLSSDPRYSLIASSSQREEIFKKHLSTLSSSNGTHSLSPAEAQRKTAEDRRARQAAALREREEKVRKEKEAVDRAAGRSRAEAGREESERLWKGLLIDAVRDHEASWSATLPTLEADPRYRSSTLSTSEKRRLFDDHLSELYTKRVAALEALFASHAPSLQTPFADVYASISANPIATRLRLSESKVERLYDAWSRKRHAQARADFDAMLSESNFVEYWGSLKNEAESARGEDDRAKGVLAAGDEDEQEEGLAATTDEADLRTLAAQVDLRELEAVLSHDKRYTIFDAEGEQRQQWIKDYLVKLGRPKKTVHQH